MKKLTGLKRILEYTAHIQFTRVPRVLRCTPKKNKPRQKKSHKYLPPIYHSTSIKNKKLS